MASKSKNDSGFIVLDFWILFGTSLSMIWYPTFYKVGIIGRVAKRPLATTTKKTKHTTTNMRRRCPASHGLCPLPPWVGQQRPQRMVPRPPMVPNEATVVRLGGAMVGLLVWGVPNITCQKIRDGYSSALNSQNLIQPARNRWLG